MDTLLALDDRLEDRLADLDDAANGEDPVAAEALTEAETEVRAVLSEHIAAQEELFPSLRDSIPAVVLEDLAEGVPLAIGGAPTRPHAGRAEGFLGEVAEGVAAATDHLRNLLHRGDRDSSAPDGVPSSAPCAGFVVSSYSSSAASSRASASPRPLAIEPVASTVLAEPIMGATAIRIAWASSRVIPLPAAAGVLAV